MFSDAYFWFDLLVIAIMVLGFGFGWTLSAFNRTDSFRELYSRILFAALCLSAYALVFALVSEHIAPYAEKMLMASYLFVAFQLLRLILVLRDKRAEWKVPYFLRH